MNRMYHLWNFATVLFGLLFLACFVFCIVMAFKEYRVDSKEIGTWGQSIGLGAFSLIASVLTLVNVYPTIINVYF